MGSVTLSGRGRRRVLKGHPWIYADDIADGEGQLGELLAVHAPDGSSLGWGLFSSHSKIAVRLVTRGKEQPKREFWAERIRCAVELRRAAGLLQPDGACRLLAGDADGVPGLVVDRYRDILVLQSGCQGSDRMLSFIVELLDEELPFEIRGIYDRSDTSVRKHEALDPRTEWLRGGGGAEVALVEVVEEIQGAPRLVYEVNVEEGHKTGHYLDQHENRIVAARMAGSGTVLDAFSYDGLFGIRAALAGATSVLCLDQSEAAGERCMRNAERNGVQDKVRFEKVNAMHDLRERAEKAESYDLTVLDPPAFARNKREAEGAVRGYRELARRGLALTRVGGALVMASCSYNTDRVTFVRCIAEGSLLAGCEARIIRFSGASPDHPVLATVPETDYLKCAYIRVGR